VKLLNYFHRHVSNCVCLLSEVNLVPQEEEEEKKRIIDYFISISFYWVFSYDDHDSELCILSVIICLRT
jgi:hypothetical protein